MDFSSTPFTPSQLGHSYDSARIVSAHQPAFCPWLGYLHRIHLSDQFVVLDDVQFEKNSFTNRNQIKGPNGKQWLTLPVLSSNNQSRSVKSILIDKTNLRWSIKMIKSIEACYSQAPYYSLHHPFFSQLFASPPDYLVDVCSLVLRYLLDVFSISTPITFQSEFETCGSKQDLILNIAQSFNASIFLFGPNGRNYVDDDLFASHGICAAYHQFSCHQYPQLWGDFIPSLSSLDLIFNICPGNLLDFICTGNPSRREFIEFSAQNIESN